MPTEEEPSKFDSLLEDLELTADEGDDVVGGFFEESPYNKTGVMQVVRIPQKDPGLVVNPTVGVRPPVLLPEDPPASSGPGTRRP